MENESSPRPSRRRRVWAVFSSILAILLLACLLAAGSFVAWVHARRGEFHPRHRGFVRFALCQIDSRVGDIRWNFLHAMDYAQDAVRHGADVVILPEFSFTTVHDVRTRLSCFNILERPEYASRLSEFTLNNGCYLFFNHPSVTNVNHRMHVYNTSYVMGPDGQLVTNYCKQAMALIDKRCFIKPGSVDVLARLPFGNVGMMICKDAYYPNHFPMYHDADVIAIQFAHIVNWGDTNAPTGLQEPMAEPATHNIPHVANLCTRQFQKPLLMVNKTGMEDMYGYVGGSRVVVANGSCIAKANSHADILYADFLLDESGRIRSDRHPVIPKNPTDYEVDKKWEKHVRSLLRLAPKVP